MPQKDVIKKMRDCLDAIQPNTKAILFGSRASGKAGKESDWDVLILLDKPSIALSDYDKYSYPLRELGWEINEIINPILFTESEWKANHFTLFNHNVSSEGIII